MALSWLNVPSALKAAIGIGKRTSGHPRQSAAPQGRGKTSVASAFARRSRRDMLNLSLSGHGPVRTSGHALSCVIRSIQPSQSWYRLPFVPRLNRPSGNITDFGS
jgi:hypothetical protein